MQTINAKIPQHFVAKYCTFGKFLTMNIVSLFFSLRSIVIRECMISSTPFITNSSLANPTLLIIIVGGEGELGMITYVYLSFFRATDCVDLTRTDLSRST